VKISWRPTCLARAREVVIHAAWLSPTVSNWLRWRCARWLLSTGVTWVISPTSRRPKVAITALDSSTSQLRGRGRRGGRPGRQAQPRHLPAAVGGTAPGQECAEAAAFIGALTGRTVPTHFGLRKGFMRRLSRIRSSRRPPQGTKRVRAGLECARFRRRAPRGVLRARSPGRAREPEDGKSGRSGGHGAGKTVEWSGHPARPAAS
jgi:hypothetical protein